jgi:hypothetical protein
VAVFLFLLLRFAADAALLLLLRLLLLIIFTAVFIVRRVSNGAEHKGWILSRVFW